MPPPGGTARRLVSGPPSLVYCRRHHPEEAREARRPRPRLGRRGVPARRRLRRPHRALPGAGRRGAIGGTARPRRRLRLRRRARRGGGASGAGPRPPRRGGAGLQPPARSRGGAVLRHLGGLRRLVPHRTVAGAEPRAGSRAGGAPSCGHQGEARPARPSPGGGVEAQGRAGEIPGPGCRASAAEDVWKGTPSPGSRQAAALRAWARADHVDFRIGRPATA